MLIVTDEPLPMSTTVEFCTKPVTGSLTKYGTKTDMPRLASNSTSWNTPATKVPGAISRLSDVRLELLPPRHPLSGAASTTKTIRKALMRPH